MVIITPETRFMVINTRNRNFLRKILTNADKVYHHTPREAPLSIQKFYPERRLIPKHRSPRKHSHKYDNCHRIGNSQKKQSQKIPQQTGFRNSFFIRICFKGLSK